MFVLNICVLYTQDFVYIFSCRNVFSAAGTGCGRVCFQAPQGFQQTHTAAALRGRARCSPDAQCCGSYLEISAEGEVFRIP